jgi:hypothetical protein
MSNSHPDYDDVLRRALHAAAESVEPSADGLDKIRERVHRVPVLSFASIAAHYCDLTAHVLAWTAPVIGACADFFWAAVDRFRPVDQPGRRRQFGWLRPVAAMGTAIFVIAAGAFAVMTLPQAISSSGSSSVLPWHSSSDSGSASGSAYAHGATPLGRHGGSTSAGHSLAGGALGGTSGGSPAASRCHLVSPAPTTSVSPSPSTSTSTSPSTSPTTTPTSPTPTSPVPTTSPPSSSNPGSDGTPTPSSSSATTDAEMIQSGTSHASGLDPNHPDGLPSPCVSTSSPAPSSPAVPQAMGLAPLNPVAVTEPGQAG